MEQPYIGFYRSRVKMFFTAILYLVVTACCILSVVASLHGDSAVLFLLFSLFTIIFFILFIIAIVGFVRDKPYIRFTETYLMLFPESFLELKIYYEDISNVSLTEVSLQKHIQVELKNEQDYYEKLSSLQILYFGQYKLFMQSFILIRYKVIAKDVQPLFLSVMEDVATLIEGKIDSIPFNYLEEDIKRAKMSSGEEFIEKLNPYVSTPLRFNITYFTKSYLISLLYFAIFGIFSYFLIGSVEYLTLSVMNFFTYPFAKVLADVIGLHKFKAKINRQQGITLHLYRVIYAFEILLYHASFILFPFGIIVLLVRFIGEKFKAKHRKQDGA